MAICQLTTLTTPRPTKNPCMNIAWGSAIQFDIKGIKVNASPHFIGIIPLRPQITNRGCADNFLCENVGVPAELANFVVHDSMIGELKWSGGKLLHVR